MSVDQAAKNVQNLQAARIVAGTLTLLSREIAEVGPPVDLWNPPIYPDFIKNTAIEVGQGQAEVLWVDDRHPAKGLLIFYPSIWESDFFGYPCARLMGPFMVVEEQLDRESRVAFLAAQAIELAKKNKIRLTTLKCFHDPAVLRGFLSKGFVLAEIGASLSGPVPNEVSETELPPGFIFLSGDELKEFSGDIVKALGDFFYDGHFRHDSKPGPEKARSLWNQVALDDINGAADPAIVLWDRKKDRPAALATVRMSGKDASLSILAVCLRYQRQGLGRIIMSELIGRLSGRAKRLNVETASYNLPALKLYNKMGLRPAPPLAALHYHLCP